MSKRRRWLLIHRYADPDRLYARVAEVAALADPVWLKKFNEDGVEVIRAVKWAPDGKTGSWTKATPEEIETGLLAETRDEFDLAGCSTTRRIRYRR